MHAVPLALTLTAALLHAAWNFLVKDDGERLPFLWLATALATLLYAPLALARLAASPALAAAAPYVLASAAVHAAYLWLLTRSYTADLSVAYPVARGVGPLLVAAGSGLVLGQRLSAAGVAGVLGVAAGVALLHRLRGRGRDRLHLRRTWPAFATGGAIAAYSFLDGLAVRHADPVAVSGLLFAAEVLLLAPWVAVSALNLWRGADWRRRGRVVAAGVFAVGGYLLVLMAFRMAPVAYVVAVRSASILAGALLGHLLLHEPVGPRRYLGAGLIAGGVAFISLGG